MSKKKKLKVILFGCGRVAQHYVKVFSAFLGEDPIEILGVFDQDAVKAASIAKELNCNVYASVEETLKAKPDLAIILTPSGLHEEHSRLFLREGISVLSEKPIGLRVSAVEENISLSTSTGVPYGVIFQNRLNPAMQFAKERVLGRKIGRIVSASVRLRWCRYQSYYEDGWHGTWRMDGGVANQQAIHHIDGLRWLIGEPKELFSIGRNQVNRLEAEDTIVAAGISTTGTLFTIEATTGARPTDHEASITLTGDRGYLCVGGVALNELTSYSSEDDDNVDLSAYSEKVESGYGVSHFRVLRSIAKTFQKTGKIEPQVSAKDGLATTKFISWLYRSNEIHQAIICDEKSFSHKLGN